MFFVECVFRKILIELGERFVWWERDGRLLTCKREGWGEVEVEELEEEVQEETMTGKVGWPVTHRPSLLSQGSFAQFFTTASCSQGVVCVASQGDDALEFSQLHAVLYHRNAALKVLSAGKTRVRTQLRGRCRLLASQLPQLT